MLDKKKGLPLPLLRKVKPIIWLNSFRNYPEKGSENNPVRPVLRKCRWRGVERGVDKQDVEWRQEVAVETACLCVKFAWRSPGYLSKADPKRWGKGTIRIKRGPGQGTPVEPLSIMNLLCPAIASVCLCPSLSRVFWVITARSAILLFDKGKREKPANSWRN